MKIMAATPVSYYQNHQRTNTENKQQAFGLVKVNGQVIDNLEKIKLVGYLNEQLEKIPQFLPIIHPIDNFCDFSPISFPSGYLPVHIKVEKFNKEHIMTINFFDGIYMDKFIEIAPDASENKMVLDFHESFLKKLFTTSKTVDGLCGNEAMIDKQSWWQEFIKKA